MGLFNSKQVKKCDPSKFATWLRDKKYWTLFHLVFGLESDIPICCCIEFCIRTKFRKLNKGLPCAVAVGCLRDGDGNKHTIESWSKTPQISFFTETRHSVSCDGEYVHCWFHRRNHFVKK